MPVYHMHTEYLQRTQESVRDALGLELVIVVCHHVGPGPLGKHPELLTISPVPADNLNTPFSRGSVGLWGIDQWKIAFLICQSPDFYPKHRGGRKG